MLKGFAYTWDPCKVPLADTILRRVDLGVRRQTDVYLKAFQLHWHFIKDYQIDNEFHGVYEMVGPDGDPVDANKGRIWKAAYHDGRALLNVSGRLRRLADGAAE